MKYISLGLNCDPAIQIVNSGKMGNKQNGRLTCPFDLMLTTYNCLCECFKTKFDEEVFFKDIKIRENPYGYRTQSGYLIHNGAYGAYSNIIVNDNLGFIMNHESPGHPILHIQEKWKSRDMFCENNFSLLKDRYFNRLHNIKKIINECQNNNEIITFLLSSDIVPITLNKIIKETFPQLEFLILVNKSPKFLSTCIQDINSCFNIKTNNDPLIKEVKYNNIDNIIILSKQELNVLDATQNNSNFF